MRWETCTIYPNPGESEVCCGNLRECSWKLLRLHDPSLLGHTPAWWICPLAHKGGGGALEKFPRACKAKFMEKGKAGNRDILSDYLSFVFVSVCLRWWGGNAEWVLTRYQSEHLRVGIPGFCYQHGHLLSVQSWVSILFCPRLNEWNCKLIKVNVPLTGLRNVFKENFDQNALYRVTLCKDISCCTRCSDLSCAA